ncbi:cilia- and flagella-associated protein 65-like isoform X4 [Rhodnius prolixus]
MMCNLEQVSKNNKLLHYDIRRKNAIIDSLKSQINESSRVISNLKSEIDKFKQKYVEAKKFNNYLYSLQPEMKSMKMENSRLEQELEQLTWEYSEFKKNHSECLTSQENQNRLNTINHLKNIIIDARKQIEASKQKINCLTETNENLQKKICHINNEMKQVCQKQLEKIKSYDEVICKLRLQITKLNNELTKIDKIVPCSYTNPFELMFEVNWQNSLTNQHTVSVIYRPIYPDRVNYGYFEVLFKGPGKLILCAKGVSKGPQINCTLTKLNICCKEKQRSVSKIVELVNMTDIPAEFHFDFDNENSELIITPLFGTVEPSKNFRLLFLFKPKRRGLFYKRLTCLLKYQAPIVIEVYAISTKSSNKQETFKFILFNQTLPTYPNNYECYLNDVVARMAPESRPFVSIDKRFIDFGNYGIINEEAMEEEFSVSNNTLISLNVVWDIDKTKCFRIVPAAVSIQPGTSYSFVAQFLPKLPDYYYCEDINASLLWGSSSEFLAPFPLTLNLIGNTFQIGLCSWDPIFHLESEEIILPATAPNIPVYTTFSIYRTGHLPLLFKFVPPKLARFSIKPMQGLITKNLQICIARLFPGSQADIGYVERWELFLNIKKKITIKFCGSAELPSLKFGDSAHITFPATAINTIYPMPLKVRNPTRLFIRFSFKGKFEEDLVFGGLPEYGIAPNQQIELKLHFYPRSEGMYSKTLLVELLYICNDSTEIKNEILLTYSGTCEKAFLKGTPEHVSLGDGLYSESIYGKFYAYNPSLCTVYVVLRFRPRDIYNNFGDPCITPSEFVLGSYQSQEITLGIVTNFPGLYYFEIIYILTRKIDCIVDEDREQLHLLYGDVCCKFPSLVVDDIRLVDEKINFSKYFFWEMLQINKINEALNELTDINGLKNITCKVPENEEDSKPLQIQFLFRNNSGLPIILKAKCITSCSCKIVPKGGRGISGWPSLCNHKNEIFFIHKDKKIKKCKSEIFQIDILYKSTDKDYFTIELTIAAAWRPEVRRNLRIHLQRRCFQRETPSADILVPYEENSTVVTFDSLFIGDPSEILQGIWLYNNSAFNVPYKVTTKENNETFYCVNDMDVIQAFSMHPVLFRFTPYEMKLFKTNVTISIADKEYHITLQGSGSADSKLKNYDLARKVPLISKFSEERGIALSMDHILIVPMPLHSVYKTVFFMRNNTKSNIYFNWKRKFLGGVYKMQVHPRLGIINAGELKMCQLQVISLSVPTRITDFMNCVLINYSTLEKYVVKRKLFNRLIRLMSEFFIYSDKYHRPDIFKCPLSNRAIPVLIKLGVSLQTFDQGRFLTANLTSQLKMLSSFAIGSALQDSFVSFRQKELTVICSVFKKIFWDVLKSTSFKKYLFKPKKDVYYLTLALHERKTILPYVRMIQNVLSECIYQGLINIFSLDDKCAEPFLKYLLAQDSKPLVDQLETLNNTYYRQTLAKGMYKLESCLLKHDRVGKSLSNRKRTTFNIKPLCSDTQHNILHKRDISSSFWLD